MAVEVPRKVYEGLERVRRSGRVDMADQARVEEALYARGEQVVCAWVDRHAPSELYDRGIREGFAPAEEEPYEAALREELADLEEQLDSAEGEYEEASDERERAEAEVAEDEELAAEGLVEAAIEDQERTWTEMEEARADRDQIKEKLELAEA